MWLDGDNLLVCSCSCVINQKITNIRNMNEAFTHTLILLIFYITGELHRLLDPYHRPLLPVRMIRLNEDELRMFHARDLTVLPHKLWKHVG